VKCQARLALRAGFGHERRRFDANYRAPHAKALLRRAKFRKSLNGQTENRRSERGDQAFCLDASHFDNRSVRRPFAKHRSEEDLSATIFRLDSLDEGSKASLSM